MIEFTYNDGGREAAGFKGQTRDCVTRAIAIVTRKPYMEVYNALNELADPFNKRHCKPRMTNSGIRMSSRSNSRTGVHKQVYHKYLLSLGMKCTPTMFIGQGCKVHLCKDELPSGKLIVAVSKHLTAVIDGVVNDIFNPAREVHCTRPNDNNPLKNGEWLHPDGDVICKIERRCVYGYYSF